MVLKVEIYEIYGFMMKILLPTGQKGSCQEVGRVYLRCCSMGISGFCILDSGFWILDSGFWINCGGS